MALIFLSVVMTLVFVVLIIRKRYSLLKSTLHLKPNKTFHIDSGVFLLCDAVSQVRFAFIKNIGCRIYVDDGWSDFSSKFASYSICRKRLLLRTNTIKLCVFSNGCKFESERDVQFSYEFIKPNFAYRFDPHKKTIVIGNNSFVLKLVGFQDLHLTLIKQNKLRISGKIQRGASIEFERACKVASRHAIKEFKQRNFGIIDTSSWEFIPRFSGHLNELQKRDVEAKFSLAARKIELPTDLKIRVEVVREQFYIDSTFYINIETLGIGKVVSLRKSGRNVFIRDLLSGVGYKFTADKPFFCRQVCFFGTNYLHVTGFSGILQMTCQPLFICGRNTIYSESMLCKDYQNNSLVNFDLVLRKLNLSILHGFWVDIKSYISRINYRFLLPFSQFLLAKVLLSFVITFKNYGLLKHSKIRNLLLRGLCYAMESKTQDSGYFCERILPLIKSERAHQRIMLHKLKCKFEFRTAEFILTRELGVTLLGDEVTICPSKNLDKETFVVIRGKKINLKIRHNWSMVRINNLGLGNIFSFDITKLDDNTLITFD